MGLKEITAGTKTALPIAMRYIEAGEDKTPAFEIAFEFEQDGKKFTLPKQLWLTEKALEYTIKTLAILNFSENDQFDPKDGVMVDKNVIDWNKEVQIVVVREVNPESGTDYPKISYVNELSGSGFKTGTPETLKNTLGALGFKAKYIAEKSKHRPKSGPIPF